ncbi:uncharacterized protein HMPREF1541_07123 [Cyphellophora europaea CBS 101466]|uniref:Uncharacterized protein n=1 Tax=Cyphellophora europaea (strain CBS 101466) TaxID=1220924 RepID=W2RLW9_CYPE1|nr:uncharacterized protein HMPREF1541_07123 [Cyphellophora europaea CBS 101466]ETN37501.1 hypothetical protein HMPREF1541_07123 [Cyphellophora europaea CBS 101466]
MSFGRIGKRTTRHTLRLSSKYASLTTRVRAINSLAPETSNNGPLKGVKVLDLSRVLAAPLCTQILGDYGADIIKIEDIGKGDDTRHFRAIGEDETWKPDVGPMSNYFCSINRNKRSVCLDLKNAPGKEILFKLVKDADVVIENMRQGAMERLGIDYEVLKQVNPTIIYASISGYGSSGPWRERAGYDMIAGAEAGLLHLTGERGGPPVRPGLGLTDMSTGLFMHGAIMAALYSRKETGLGQRIDASLFESQIALLINVALTWLNMGQETERWGTQHPSVVPYDAFRTKDLYFVCGAVNNKQFEKLCKILDVEHLLEDPRFKTNSTRVTHRDDLMPTISEAFQGKTAGEWMQAFEGSGMPYAPINTMEKVFSHPQTAAREMVSEIQFEPAKSGKLSMLGSAVKFSNTSTSVRRKPPLLGEHTDEVLREIGVTEAEIESLRSSRVVR